MKAVTIRKFGSPDSLKLEEVTNPSPKKNEVLIQVRAASINAWDWDYLKGKPYIYRLLFGFFKPRHQILGADIAGIIEAVGSEVTQFHVGQEVYGDLSGSDWGGFAEYTTAKANILSIKPKNLSFEEAATVPQAAVLALQSLHYCRDIEKGDEILINGAGGGFGVFAIQMAKSKSAVVTGVDHTTKLALMQKLGADHTIDYTKEDYLKNGKKYDRIVDIVANKTSSSYMRSLKTNGIFVMVGGTVKSLLNLAIWGPIKSRKGMKLGILPYQLSSTDLDFLRELFEKNKLKTVIDRRFPLSETAAAFTLFGTGQVKGKVVISIPE